MSLNVLVDSRDTRFVLYELLEAHKRWKEIPEFADCDEETAEDFLNLAEKMAVEQNYPANAKGDAEGCTFDAETKEVKIPSCYKEPLDAFYEAGFIGIADSPEFGGMGMPASLGLACTEFFTAANMTMMMYPGLSHGAMKLIKHWGSEEQKALYIPKLQSGEWGGTMCLTEPSAGSDVGQLKSKAVKQDDGTYLITGQNIFISSGENDYYENIIHLKLARIEGDPLGTGGLSLFLVPKFLVNPDGSLGERNDVYATGIEHKMGIKGSATTSLAFGDNGKCVGYLVGQERQGMQVMFQMMNEERAMVGCQGLGQASTAYMHAATYARTRIQGAKVLEMLNPDPKPIPIINHPDVRRMLLYMKSHVEAMRAFTLYGGHNTDIEMHSEGEEKEEAFRLNEFFRPIIKAGNTDAAMRVTSEAVQAYGGYGYCSEYPVEQMMRDTRILPIYEGTNGIQSMDFTMRKLMLDEGQKNYETAKKRILEAIEKARGVVEDKYVDIVERGIQKFDETIEMMKGQLKAGQFLHLFMEATPLQEAMSMLTYAWVLLMSLTVAYPKMKELIGDAQGEALEKLLEDNSEAAFYYGKVLSCQFYITSVFPTFFGRMESLMIIDEAAINAHNPSFTGMPLE